MPSGSYCEMRNIAYYAVICILYSSLIAITATIVLPAYPGAEARSLSGAQAARGYIMLEFNGYKIVYEVLSLPRGKWAIVVEVIRKKDGEIIEKRHNPFPHQSFDTKLEALDQVNRYLKSTLESEDEEPRAARRA